VRTIDASYSGVYPEEAIAFFKKYHSAEHILKDAESGYTLIFEDRDTIIGTGTLAGTNVRRFFIAPEQHHKGIGKYIALALEKKALIDGKSILDLESSLVAVEFWKTLGYIVEKEDYIPIGNGERLNYFRMVKKLDKPAVKSENNLS
jgi:GNAT superfamily N-acetyltransferase